jgi:hypothetical protein
MHILVNITCRVKKSTDCNRNVIYDHSIQGDSEVLNIIHSLYFGYSIATTCKQGAQRRITLIWHTLFFQVFADLSCYETQLVGLSVLSPRCRNINVSANLAIQSF